MAGPGTEIKKLLVAFGIRAYEGCGCSSLAAEMDKIGADEVEKRLEEYRERMKEGIKKWRGKVPIPIPPDFVVEQLILYGIKKSRGL